MGVRGVIPYMLDAGIDTFVEIGPRKNFIKFCKEKHKRKECKNIEY